MGSKLGAPSSIPRIASRLAIFCAFLAASLLLGGILLEVALRLGVVSNPQHSRRSLQGETERPSHRLLILGDSFIAQGSGLAPLLVADLGAHGVAVLNTATSGSGPFEYRAELEATGAAFGPDVVLLSYYAGNDLTNVKNHELFVDDSPARGVAIDRTATRPVVRHLYLYSYLRKTVLTRLRTVFYFDYDAAARAGVSPELIEAAKRREINPWLLERSVADRDYLLHNVLMESPDDMLAWARVEELLSDIEEICETIGAQLVIVIFPRSIQVNRSHFEFYEDLALNLDDRTLGPAKPQRLLLDFCTRKRLDCLDILPVFRARADEEFYLHRDSHLNDAGNRLSGELILQFLLERTPIG